MSQRVGNERSTLFRPSGWTDEKNYCASRRIRVLLIGFIRTVHIVVLLYVLLVPFFGGFLTCMSYAVSVPFLLVHWARNNDMCVLTQIEMYLTGKTKTHTIMHSIMGPIYTLPNGKTQVIIWYGGTASLWLIVMVRLLYLHVSAL